MKNALLKKLLLFVCVITVAACTGQKDDESTSGGDSTNNSGGGNSGGNPGGGGNENQGETPTNPGGGTNPGEEPNTGGGTNPPDEPANPPSQTCNPVVGTVSAPTASLNNGATTTTSVVVQFQFMGEEILKMKVSDNDQCLCGTWENFAETKDWTLKRENSSNNVSVQFRDYEGRYSSCVPFSILHDSLAPTVSVALDASNTYESGKDTKLNLSVQDLGSGVKTVACTLNSVATNCAAGVSVLTFSAQADGAYTFAVTATDQLGHSSSGSVSWTVITPYQQIVQQHEVKSNNKVDILLVDDNSASMLYEQERMAKRMATFLSVLNGLDWRIAITTTDPDTDVAWGDGRLLEMKGLNKEYHISSTTDPKKAQKALEDTIQRKETGSPSEQGINATYRAIERSFVATNPNAQFFRSDANFATVVISDEDESAKNMRNIPENLLAFVKKTWPVKNFAFHSIINRTGDVQCKNTQGNTYGAAYEKMSLLTGAGMIGGSIIGTVCADDYGSQLNGIGGSVQAMQKIIDLQCAPVGNQGSNVIIQLNGNNYTAPYQVDDTRLVFQSNLPVGQYVLQYTCRK